MDITRAIETFSALSPEEKTEFLARVAQALTILARDTYEVGQEGLVNPLRMRALNEVQHAVAGQLLALLREDLHRYPDDVLVQLILEPRRDLILHQQLHSLWARLSSQKSACA